jgi:uncharacterized membrane protein YgcG
MCYFFLVGLLRLAVSIWAIVLFAELRRSGNACRVAWDAANVDVWRVVLAEFAITFCFVVLECCCVFSFFGAATLQATERRRVVANEEPLLRAHALERGAGPRAPFQAGGGGGGDGGGGDSPPV